MKQTSDRPKNHYLIFDKENGEILNLVVKEDFSTVQDFQSKYPNISLINGVKLSIGGFFDEGDRIKKKPLELAELIANYVVEPNTFGYELKKGHPKEKDLSLRVSADTVDKENFIGKQREIINEKDSEIEELNQKIKFLESQVESNKKILAEEQNKAQANIKEYYDLTAKYDEVNKILLEKNNKIKELEARTLQIAKNEIKTTTI